VVDLSFLSPRGERAILEATGRHLGVVGQTVDAFCDGVGAAAMGDRKDTLDPNREVAYGETEASVERGALTAQSLE
jgi:hypothetical protein